MKKTDWSEAGRRAWETRRANNLKTYIYPKGWPTVGQNGWITEPHDENGSLIAYFKANEATLAFAKPNGKWHRMRWADVLEKLLA